jgi:hypothetical protein
MQLDIKVMAYEQNSAVTNNHNNTGIVTTVLLRWLKTSTELYVEDTQVSNLTRSSAVSQQVGTQQYRSTIV